MSAPDQLEAMSDAELNEAFAVEVVGLTRLRDSTRWEMTDPPDDPIVRVGRDISGLKVRVLDFSTSADAVLPWLEKHHHCDISWLRSRAEFRDQWSVKVREGNDVFRGDANNFARAACIALLRATRNQTKVTKWK